MWSLRAESRPCFVLGDVAVCRRRGPKGGLTQTQLVNQFAEFSVCCDECFNTKVQYVLAHWKRGQGICKELAIEVALQNFSGAVVFPGQPINKTLYSPHKESCYVFVFTNVFDVSKMRFFMAARTWHVKLYGRRCEASAAPWPAALWNPRCEPPEIKKANLSVECEDSW